jgi:hypothetical protein
MRPLHVAVLALAPLVPLHSGHLHLVTDSVIGVAVGVAVVGLYVLALRWTGGDRSEGPGETRSRDRRSNQ